MSDATLRSVAADNAATNLEGTWFAILSSGTEVSTARIQPAYNAASSGSATLTAPLAFTGPASQAVTDLGVYTAATLGTLRFSVALAGDLSFNAAGELTLAAAPVVVS